MRIFLDGHFLDGQKHGVAVYLLSLYTVLVIARPDISLFVGLEKGSDVSAPLYNNPNVKKLYYDRGGWLRFLFDIPILVSKIQPDVVHTQNAIPVFRKPGVDYHVTLFDVLYEDYPMYFGLRYRLSRSILFKFAARESNILSTCSDYSAKRIRAHYLRGRRFVGKLIHVIPPGIALNESDSIEATSPFSFKFLLYVSRFEIRKNHLMLVEAFNKVSQEHPELKLVLVGFEIDGSLAETRALVDKLSISRSVVFESNIPQSRLLALYKSAELVVYPSRCEGFGMPILESMLVNPRLIFSNTSSMSDFGFASECFMESYSSEAIANKVMESLAYPSLIEGRYETRKKFIREHYLWSHSGELLSQLYSLSKIDFTQRS